MTEGHSEPDNQAEANSRPELWRQGDILQPGIFAWLDASLDGSGQDSSGVAEGDLVVVKERFPEGVAVVTPTCDIYPRPDRERPFVVVAPIVVLDGALADEARARRRPRFAHLPGAPDAGSFADLDRAMTVHKSVLSRGSRTEGLRTDDERVAFTRAVSRKFSRFAFPDALASTLAPWRDRVVGRHNRTASDEGKLYRQAVAIQVSCRPSWQAPEDVTVSMIMRPGLLPERADEPEPTIADVDRVARADLSVLASWIVRPAEGPQCTGHVIETLESRWADLCMPTDPITSVEFRLVGADEITVADYLATQPLDLEFLSDRSPAAD